MNVSSSFPYFSDASINAILVDMTQMLRSGKLTDGPFSQEFERQFAAYNNAKYAIAVNSGSAALDVALRPFKLQGKEVIVPTNTFVSTPNSVVFAGGNPIFADMNPHTLCIDTEDVKRRVTPKTAGVIVVHIAGLVCPQIRELEEFCKAQGLFLIEDSAHAHGATLDGQKAGTFGDVGCFSFYPTKVMTTCEGGMILTNDEELAAEARCLRSCGQNADRQMIMLGDNWRLSEPAAIVGLHQLEHLEEFLAKRNQIAAWYEKALGNIEEISLLKPPSNIRHSYYKYPLILATSINRQKVAVDLKETFGVESGHIYYPPCHLHPYYMETFGTRMGNLPTAERVLKQVLCLPMHYLITQQSVEYICDALVSTIKSVSSNV
ncbi:MAG: DegT/DnrJ/EryC1/StrS family aminotransferase [Nitrososphaerota archaeon]|jgi:dTDP-4-amino-4,6-dideoxygalactose transaminase|nr:DegT/DnrJ/EryC1/StrS family aminotransferase [Nitrososphaerota archaeon]